MSAKEIKESKEKFENFIWGKGVYGEGWLFGYADKKMEEGTG